MRKEFKKVKIKDSRYLYPLPVIKGNKYLISAKEGHEEFFIDSWKYGFLPTPDEGPEYLEFLGLHTDQQTNIFTINFDKLSFRFLSEKSAKGERIEDVLSSKIVLFLKEEIQSQELIKSFSKQVKCQTCISLGINSPEVLGWISNLIDLPAD